MKPQEKAIYTLQFALSGAHDDLSRSKQRFQPAQVDMNAEYGNSGRTRQELLDADQRKYDETKAALAWVESQTS